VRCRTDGDYFSVEDRFVVRPLTGAQAGAGLSIDVCCEAAFTKSTLLKSTIAKRSKGDGLKMMEDILQKMREHVAATGSAIVAPVAAPTAGAQVTYAAAAAAGGMAGRSTGRGKGGASRGGSSRRSRNRSRSREPARKAPPMPASLKLLVVVSVLGFSYALYLLVQLSASVAALHEEIRSLRDAVHQQGQQCGGK